MKKGYAKKISKLESGPEYWFSDWPNSDVPRVAAGLYSVWLKDRFIYIGMSGRGLSKKEIEASRKGGHQPRGLFTRLNSHALGRRGGDQFCLYICDRYVIPSLTKGQIQQVGSGSLSLDQLTREFIHQHLTYRFVTVDDGTEALALEAYIKANGLSGKQPILNPSQNET